MSQASRVWTAIDFTADGKQSDYLRVPYSSDKSAYGWIPVPLVCVRNGEGPTVLLTAGNHGDEYEGQVALLRLARELDPAAVRGRIIIAPALNFPAVAAGRRTSPIDEGNLNRLFPGDANGSPTAMIAHYVQTVLFPLSDLVIDLHSGGKSLEYTPCALARHGRDAAAQAEILRLLEVFGAPLSIQTTGEGGGASTTLYAAATQLGIPALTTELGGGGTLIPLGLQVAEQGVRRVLKHYGYVPDMAVEPAPPLQVKQSQGRSHFLYAAEDGLFEPFVAVGSEVSAGQLAGYLHPYHSPLREPVALRFPAGGIVSCRRFPTLTERGDCLYNLVA
ncbi:MULTISPECIES: succinylglutamate desuccinylase/aspartoacylase family protein [unclassified Achromobacter]|uniref:succinylglutamate desuccinylase/aspartoacylase family protein n=1 Tax=unclassified Achromobacter TaxID=2626865 RepID=UPI000B51E4D1|nr:MULTISPECIES: succinylglutamate desuccinylase/aspartoacylase family protein [unclassified Achromobacter]OWT69086.1 succinylglutamate desuccinylase [Achromobacter sp. HZ34]OWT70491.1 succinylglutamate desuccinylase [Achromobacter sp. HZ28]